MTSFKIVRRIIVSLGLTFCAAFGYGQVHRIETENKVIDDAFEKSQSILPIYKFVSDSIEPYSKFGIKRDTTKPWNKVKQMPIMKGCSDTGYTYIYFAGADNANSQGYVLTMVGNFRRSRRNVYFYIDRNNDFDFTNDGAPDSLPWQATTIELELENSRIPGATYGLKLTRFKYGENVRYKNLLTEHYRAHSGKKQFTNINYCYREQRYNCVIGHYKNGTDSFSIGIKDLNVNGVYNESCTDLLYVGQYHSQIVSDKLVNIVPTIQNNVFEWGGKKYRIKSIETTGKYIEIERDDNAVLSNKLEQGKSTPNFTYFNVFNKEHQLKEYKRSQVYLFFWDLDAISDEDTMYLNKLNKEFADDLKLITLNHGDKPKNVKIAFYYDKIAWPVGYSNSEIGGKYYIEDVPRGYYLGKRCKLKNDNISPKEMYELMRIQLAESLSN